MIKLSRLQILAFRQQACSLDKRLPAGTDSLRRAAWAGLQDSMPRAALLSIHARVEGAASGHWEHPSLVQIWGPRYSNYVVAKKDLPLFTLGRLPDDARGRGRAFDIAYRLHAFLDGRQMPFGQAGRSLGVPPNSLRYAVTTGTVLMRWNGAHQPVIWSAPEPGLAPGHARLELARRYFHIFAPATVASFAKWAGIRPAEAQTAFTALRDALAPVQTPIGDAWIFKEDEVSFRNRPTSAPGVRLLPSGDAYYLLWGRDRELLVPNARQRAALWTTRVWPGALLVHGEIVGVWRRSAEDVSIDVWRRLSSGEREAVEAEVMSLPLPGLAKRLAIRWTTG